MKAGTVQKTYDTLLLLLFLLVITVPLVKGIVTTDETWSATEKRVLEDFPDFPQTLNRAHAFLKDFEKYYNDHFGFREELILRYNREMEHRFGIAGTPLVLKGQGKWLFFTADDLLEDYLGKKQLSSTDFEKWYGEQLRRYNWLQRQDIKYLTFSPPNKQTIYPEKMPEEYRHAGGITKIEQLHGYLQDKPMPFYLNFHDAMRRAKTQRKLYFATDTHWNPYGAYVGFKEITAKLQQLFPESDFVTEFAFHKHYRRSAGGDLARMLMIEKTTSESMPKARPRDYCSQRVPFEADLTDIGTKKHEIPVYKRCDNASIKAVVFCDSFIDFLEPFLSENFGHVLYLRKGYDQRNIEQVFHIFKPDIVIEERVERNFFRDFSISH